MLAVTPLAFFGVQIKVNFDSVEADHPAFGEAPERFDAVEVHPALRSFLPVDMGVFVEPHIYQPIIDGSAVRADDAGWIDLALDHRSQSSSRAVLDDLGVNFSLAFEDAKDQLLRTCHVHAGGVAGSPVPNWNRSSFQGRSPKSPGQPPLVGNHAYQCQAPAYDRRWRAVTRSASAANRS